MRSLEGEMLTRSSIWRLVMHEHSENSSKKKRAHIAALKLVRKEHSLYR